MFPAWYRPPILRRYSGVQILAHTARLYDVNVEDIVGPSRLRRICEARWATMRAMEARGLSTTRIGQLLNRDHSTVVHGLRRAG